MEAYSTTKMEDWKATEFPLQVGIGNYFPSVHRHHRSIPLTKLRKDGAHAQQRSLRSIYFAWHFSNLFIAFTNCEGSINAIKIMGVKERRWGIARASRIQKVRLLLLNFNYKEGG